MGRVIGWLRTARGPMAYVWHRHTPTPGWTVAVPAPGGVPGLEQGRHGASWPATVRHGAMFALRFGAQCLILCLLFGVGTSLSAAFSLPLPGNLIGLLLLLLLLGTGVLRPEHLQDVAPLVSKHLNFFFIPLVVGLMAWTDLLVASGFVLAVSLVGSAVVGIATAGLIAKGTGRKRGTQHVSS